MKQNKKDVEVLLAAIEITHHRNLDDDCEVAGKVATALPVVRHLRAVLGDEWWQKFQDATAPESEPDPELAREIAMGGACGDNSDC